MEDPEVVAAIVAGDPAGLADAYDRYALRLYSYCRSMLGEPADAADAVQDTFLIATAKLHALGDRSKLCPWFYLVARNECLRRLRAGTARSAPEEAADMPTPAAETGWAEVQALVRSAIDGLNPGERDVIELSLVHELNGGDLATVLGVSRNHAHALLSRAHAQLERALGALIVARTGRSACADLNAMLTGWDGRMTVLLRKRISRHTEVCDICAERKRRELTPALYAAAVPIVALVPGFREQLLWVLADRSPAGLAHRLTVANRTGPFGPSGFPKPLSPPGTGLWHHVLDHPRAAVAGAATSVMAAGVIAAIVMAVPSHGMPSGGSTHGASINGPSPGRGSAPSRGAGNGGIGLAPSASTPDGTTTPVSLRSPGPAGSAEGTPASPASSGGSSSSAPSSAPAGAGTLSVSTSKVDLVAVNGIGTGSFMLTANGGPVSYSIAVGSALAGSLSVSPSSGSLATGASVTINVTSESLVALDGRLTVNPGGQTITVVFSIAV